MLLTLSFATVFLGFGTILAAMLGFAIIVLRQTRVGPQGLSAEGVVVDYQDEVHHGAGSDRPSAYTRLRVRFTTATGEEVTAATPTGNSLARWQYKPGRRVQVRYDPANPQQITVEAFDQFNRAFILVIFGIIVVGFVVLGLLFWGMSRLLPH